MQSDDNRNSEYENAELDGIFAELFTSSRAWAAGTFTLYMHV